MAPTEATKMENKPPNRKLVYLAEGNEQVASDLTSLLINNDFRVQHFKDLNDFEAACNHKIPDIVLMQVAFKDNNIAGAEVINRLKEGAIDCPPVIFISTENNIETRLAAARAGANRFFFNSS